MPYADPDKRREYNRHYRKNSASKKAAANRRWYLANKPRYLEYAVQSRAKRQDAIREDNRRYRESNPEYFRRWRKENADKKREECRRRRALKAGAPQGDPADAAAFAEILRHGICEQCGSRGPVHVDHIEALSTGGEHGWENFAGLCPSCNSSKGVRPLLLGMLV